MSNYVKTFHCCRREVVTGRTDGFWSLATAVRQKLPDEVWAFYSNGCIDAALRIRLDTTRKCYQVSNGRFLRNAPCFRSHVYIRHPLRVTAIKIASPISFSTTHTHTQTLVDYIASRTNRHGIIWSYQPNSRRRRLGRHSSPHRPASETVAVVWRPSVSPLGHVLHRLPDSWFRYWRTDLSRTDAQKQTLPCHRAFFPCLINRPLLSSTHPGWMFMTGPWGQRVMSCKRAKR